MSIEVYKSSRGTLVRVRDRTSFVGDLYLVAELVYPTGEAIVRAVRPETLEGWERATTDEWVRAVELATARQKREKKRRRAAEDAERWGLEVRVMGRYHTNHGTTHVVRSTKTQLTTSCGSRWSRVTGKIIGGGSGRLRIDYEYLVKVNDYLGDRGRVDIVAERKAAAAGGEKS
jgi:hypothetical protein